MTAQRIKEVIDAAFLSLARAAESNTDADKYVQKAFEVAFADEKYHRQHEWAPTERPRSTLKTVARYFVVKWYLDPAVIRDAAQALALRQDCLYASAVRVLLGDVPSVMKLAAEFETIDYKDHLSAPAKA